jgi:hypothetical protein
MTMRTQCFRGSRPMTTGQSAENGKPLNGAKYPNRSEIAAPLSASPQARLEYIADMVQELKIMSEQADCQVLADLLGQAYREAVRRRRSGA